MVSGMDETQHQLNEEGRAIWDSKAAFWDQLHGDSGNMFQRKLISPAVERLLDIQADERVLDIACGNGVMARRLAQIGAQVTAVDFSPELIARAKARGQAAGNPIDYHIVDATDEQALVSLGEGKFDAIICNMALMDIPVIAPLYRAVTRLLNTKGRFVIATAHPAFNSNNPTFFAEDADVDGRIVTTIGMKITGYLSIASSKQMGAPGEPAPHHYYHRPLYQLLGEAFDAGLVVDGIEEPGFLAEDANPSRLLRWVNMPQIPPVFAARFRRAA